MKDKSKLRFTDTGFGIDEISKEGIKRNIKTLELISNQATGGREMSFQECCESTGMDETRVVKHDMVSMCTLKECWDYQQEKIQKLEKALEVARGGLKFYDEAHRLNWTIDLNKLSRIATETEKQIKEILGSEDE